MIKKLKRSIETMPRAAYIFLINSLRLSCLMLASSLLLFISADANLFDYEKLKLAVFLLESPAGLLLISVIGFAFILDHS